MSGLYSYQDFCMNTVIEQIIFGDRAKEAYLKVKNTLINMESSLSYFRQDSIVSKINKSSGVYSVSAPDAVLHILIVRYTHMLLWLCADFPGSCSTWKYHPVAVQKPMMNQFFGAYPP